MITVAHIKDMIVHWLATPVNGYFAQSYGCNIREQLLQELSSFTADKFIEKMKQDIPILQQLDSDQLAIIAQSNGFATVNVFIQLGNMLIEVGVGKQQTLKQDFYHVTAS